MNPGVGVEKIAAVDEENPFSLLAGLFDKSCAPGQTAKQKVFSAAGLDFSKHVGGENDGKVFSRPGVGGLRPAGNGGQKNEQNNSENLGQENLLKKDRSAERRQTNGLGFVFIQKTLDFRSRGNYVIPPPRRQSFQGEREFPYGSWNSSG
jgi:hypothetical protein